MAEKLDLHQRKEIAENLWRIFALIAPKVAFSFDRDGVTIRVNFQEETDLDGPELISGVIVDYNEYHETSIGKRRDR